VCDQLTYLDPIRTSRIRWKAHILQPVIVEDVSSAEGYLNTSSGCSMSTTRKVHKSEVYNLGIDEDETMTGSENTCDYVARKEDPSNWHGDNPDDWLLEAEAPVGLELAVWECPHDTLDGEEHCVFHTDPEDVPDDVDEGEQFVAAVNEASAVDDEEMARRRKEFVGATFGAFDIAEATLDAGDEYPIRLDHASFARGVNAENAVFEHSLLAVGARFETGDRESTGEIGEVSFVGAEFGNGEVLFGRAEFGDGEVSFVGAEFGDGEVSFVGAEFGEGKVSFRRAEFGDGRVSFGRAEFGDGEVWFNGAEFGEGKVSFGDAEFGDGEVSFGDAEFSDGEVSFGRAEFGDGEVSFGRAEFGDGEVSFGRAEFGDGGVSFGRAEFGEGKVSFRRAEFGDGEVSFGDAEFGDGEVWFGAVEFGEGKVSFKWAEFGDGEVSFVGAEFGDGEVSFKWVEFGDGEVSFGDAEFGDGEVSFGAVEFGDGEVSFVGAEFGDGEVLFVGAEFGDGEVLFVGVEFGDGEVSFGDAEFGEGKVLFIRAEFGDGEVSFGDAEFGDREVSFGRAEFGDGEVSFGRAEFGDGEVSFGRAEFGDGEVSFGAVEFGEGKVSFDRAEFGEGKASFNSAIITSALSFIDTRFDVESTVVFSDAEFRDDVTFGFGDDEIVPYAQHSFDFSGATFRRTLEFHGGTDSTTRTEQSDPEETQFDFVFAGDVDFSNVTFPDGVDLSTTRFPSEADFTDATLEDADFSDSDMTGTDDSSTASFDGAKLTGANLSRANLAGASFERARLSVTELLGANFAGTKLYGALLGDARINRETEFWLAEDDTRREPDSSTSPVRALRRVKMAFQERDPYCPYDPRYRGNDIRPNLEKAGEVYTTLETLARDNSLPGLASKCFLGRKDVQIREYWRDGNTMMIVRSLVPNLVARYGESPARVLGTGVATVLTFGLAYYAFDLIEHTDTEDPVTLFDGLYFSALTFTTLGYGDFNPANSAGQVLAVAETSMGVILLAILVFVFGRRATR